MPAYGTVKRVETRVRDLVAGGSFSTGTTPSTSEVEVLIDDVDAELDALLEVAGYQTSVDSGTHANAYNLLRAASSAETAARLLATRPNVSFDPDATDAFTSRARSLHGEYRRVIEMIQQHRIPAAATTSPFAKAFAGSQESKAGERKQPIFNRTLTDFPGVRNLKGDT